MQNVHIVHIDHNVKNVHNVHIVHNVHVVIFIMFILYILYYKRRQDQEVISTGSGGYTNRIRRLYQQDQEVLFS